jgi:hypothetical protein
MSFRRSGTQRTGQSAKIEADVAKICGRGSDTKHQVNLRHVQPGVPPQIHELQIPR